MNHSVPKKSQGMEWISSPGKLPPGIRFDWVLLIEVIEHLHDPVRELRIIRKLLAPGGKLALTTPNSKGWRARIEGLRWREAQNPTHLHIFSLPAITACLTRSGFHHIRRIYRPARYQEKKLNQTLLAITQMLGIDGGMRITAQPDLSP